MRLGAFIAAAALAAAAATATADSLQLQSEIAATVAGLQTHVLESEVPTSADDQYAVMFDAGECAHKHRIAPPAVLRGAQPFSKPARILQAPAGRACTFSAGLRCGGVRSHCPRPPPSRCTASPTTRVRSGCGISVAASWSVGARAAITGTATASPVCCRAGKGVQLKEGRAIVSALLDSVSRPPPPHAGSHWPRLPPLVTHPSLPPMPACDEPVQVKTKHLPGKDYSKIPVFLFATAGLRIIDDAARATAVDDLRSIFARSGFMFSDPSWARMISGEEEASFDFLATQ